MTWFRKPSFKVLVFFGYLILSSTFKNKKRVGNVMAKKSENHFDKAQSLLDNGKPEQALKLLRKNWDAENESPRTYKLAGDAKVQMASLTDSIFEKKKFSYY